MNEKVEPKKVCIPGTKYDQEKRDWTLIPWDALEEVVKVLEFGAEKYSRDNWHHVMPRERYDQASMRHRIAYQNGEKLDPESGLSHLAHEMCCCLFKLWYDKNDQEPKQDTIGDNPEIFETCEGSGISGERCEGDCRDGANRICKGDETGECVDGYLKCPDCNGTGEVA